MITTLFNHWTKKLHLHISYNAKLILLFCWIVGIFLAIATPPFQKPDEPVHFYKAISIASGNIICTKNTTGESQNFVPKYLLTFPEIVHIRAIASNPNGIFPRRTYIDILQQDYFDTTLVNEPSSCSLPFFLYLHLGAALSGAVFFSMNPLLIFYLGRVVNFTTAFCIFVFAIKKTPSRLRSIPLVVLMIPMTLHQMGSYSKDALHLAAGTVVIAYLLRKFANKNSFTRLDYVWFFVSLAITILSRPYYIGLSLLALLIIPENQDHFTRYRKFSFIAFPLLIAGTIMTLVSLNIYVSPKISQEEMIAYSSVMPGKQIEYLKENPTIFPTILAQTFEEKIWFLAKSLIGQFGWLDYALQWYVYFAYTIIILYAFHFEKKNIPLLSLRQIFLITSSICITIFAVTLSFYIYLTPVSSPSVEGLQGRYFIILLPLILLTCVELWHRYKVRFLQVALIILACSIGYSVINRYYDYTRYYYRQTNQAFDNAIIGRLPIMTTHTEHITVDGTKKLKGITMNVKQDTEFMNDSIRIRILQPDCSTQITQKVFPAPLFQVDGDVYLTFPQTISNQPDLCIQIEPFSPIDTDDKTLNVAIDTKTGHVLIAPLYLH